MLTRFEWLLLYTAFSFVTFFLACAIEWWHGHDLRVNETMAMFFASFFPISNIIIFGLTVQELILISWRKVGRRFWTATLLKGRKQ